MVTGMLNKQIGERLGVAEKTIKVHRGRVMQKMAAASVADLVRMLHKLGRETSRAPAIGAGLWDQRPIADDRRVPGRVTFGMMSREVLHPEVRQVPMVCVIDDDDSLLRALRRLLDATGFRVETFSSAEQFLESDHRGRADCLILDVHLERPEWTGTAGAARQVGGEHAGRDHHRPRRALDTGASPAGRRRRVSEEAVRRRHTD